MDIFLNYKEEKSISQKIKELESTTSGEIRVHIDYRLSDRDAYERATEVFYELNMDKTAKKNAVLLYIAVDKKEVVIVGDEAVNSLVTQDFWEDIIQLAIANFKVQENCQGIIKSLDKIGVFLLQQFPRQGKACDINKLSNEVSYCE